MDAFSLQYAHALADVVMADKLDINEIDRQLEDFQATWTDSRQLREVFQNPSIQLDTKLKVLDAMVPRIGMLKQVRSSRLPPTTAMRSTVGGVSAKRRSPVSAN